MFDFVVGLSNIIAAVLGLVAIIIALGVGTVTWQRFYLGQLRWHRIGKELRRARPTLSRGEFSRATYRLLDQRIIQGKTSTVQEMNWLTGLIGAIEEERIETYQDTVRVPFTYHLGGESSATHQNRLHALADSYREYGAAVRRRWMLRTAAAPIVAEEYECSRVMASLIDSYARLQGTTPSEESRRLRDRTVGLATASDGLEQWVRLAAWPNLGIYRKSPCFAAVKVSYAPYRVVTSAESIAHRTLPEGAEAVKILRPEEVETPSGNDFDGIMSRLHGKSGYRVEMDPHSGRQQLHLCLSETSYFAFRLTQWNEASPLANRPEHAYQSRLLSVNLLLLDDADRVILVRRASTITHGGQFAGAASGACEVVARDGIEADLDADGLPDPMRTVIREAREELGIDLGRPERKLGALGLIEVMSPRDMRTYVLTVTARIEGPATEFRVISGSTDDIEGTWELGTDAMVIDLRMALSSAVAMREFVGWLKASPVILPHAAGGLLLLLVARLELGTANSNERRMELRDLVDALDVPAAASPSILPPCVTLQSLMGT
ncbi:MAG: hypothetical protein JWP64_1054 [Pseudonocardia sp.]|uniref:hypothetical protein n=1 Tax=Pseudonocardia sp. TaxID=60912 RepID=UPI002638CEA4|nr:hypothetical protein [Pseudonocardia sp.]MCU1626105.1 hypothetical protein [Pseudonocardia sp.]